MEIQKLKIKDKPLKIKLADSLDYYEIFNKMEASYKNCYLFESLQITKHQDRFVTMGFEPLMTIFCSSKRLFFESESGELNKIFPKLPNNTKKYDLKVEDPYKFLRQIFPQKTFSSAKEGGLIGYFSYEAINLFEKSLDLKEDKNFGLFKLGFYTDGLVYDISTGTTYYYSFLEDRSKLYQNLIKKPNKNKHTIKKVEFLGDSSTQESHSKTVVDSLLEIKKGNSFQLEIGFKTFYKISGRKKIIYDKLRQINPSPYMYYVKFDQKIMFGASPEILISSNNSEVITTPAAGTIKRDKNLLKDLALARELLSDPKEIAEHNMLVDLHRNDLGKICKFGSVKVKDLMYLIKFSHVQHIASDIVGILQKDKDCFDVLACILPGGVLTGTPKIETMKIIARNESLPRGPYGGAVGRFSFNNDCTFVLPIRSLYCNGDDCFTQTSSGVVLDSDPKKEYQEVKKKLEAMKTTINQVLAENSLNI
jgi:anthranilate synthase component I